MGRRKTVIKYTPPKTRKFSNRTYHLEGSFRNKSMFHKAQRNYQNMDYYTFDYITFKNKVKKHNLYVCKKPQFVINKKKPKGLKVKYGAQKRRFNNKVFYFVYASLKKEEILKRRKQYTDKYYTRMGEKEGKQCLYIRLKSKGKI